MLLCWWGLVVVCGWSMLPMLHDGDRLLVWWGVVL